MTRIALLTPDPTDPSYASKWPGVRDRLSAALAGAGIEAVATPWTDHVTGAAGLTGFSLVLPMIVWGYHRDHPRWLQACATWTAAGLPLANPTSVLAWNSDKAYLGRLAGRGVPMPETIWSDAVTTATVVAAFDTTGAERLIVKPTVSAGAWQTQLVSRGQIPTDLPTEAAMIQPYLPTIETAGETSLIFFGDRFSHAINKRPATGDFRIQDQYGGLYTPLVQPPAAALALAQQVLAAIDEPLLYARIDMVPDGDGRWLLMEAELIEPDIYLDHAPDGGAAFARAVRARL
ncbi:transporter [uncultured Brevundimonas sp.]|uniref:ATP-grasp domain-containing protein n=1 Tax=uncultured Brevundimonas sp. TaxID=213418 RepID=UPI0030EC2916